MLSSTWCNSTQTTLLLYLYQVFTPTPRFSYYYLTRSYISTLNIQQHKKRFLQQQMPKDSETYSLQSFKFKETSGIIFKVTSLQNPILAHLRTLSSHVRRSSSDNRPHCKSFCSQGDWSSTTSLGVSHTD